MPTVVWQGCLVVRLDLSLLRQAFEPHLLDHVVYGQG